jgi:hypothetical protein
MSGRLCCLVTFNDSVTGTTRRTWIPLSAGCIKQGWHRSDGRDEVADRAGTNPAGMGSFKL